MNKRNLNNSELDSIGKKLIERGSLPTAEIDKIVSNEDLFSLINARIMASGEMPEANGFTPWSVSVFIQRNSVAFGGVAVMLTAAIIAFSVLRSDKVHNTATEVVSVPVEKPAVARPEPPPQVVGRNPSPGRAQDRDMRVENAVVTTSRNSSRRIQRDTSNEPDGEFYAVSYAGDPDDNSDGGRIIRVDMSRSSLFALGINVPLENADEVLKADLLVGSDGITRAVRIIK